jgi:hypothetical protein
MEHKRKNQQKPTIIFYLKNFYSFFYTSNSSFISGFGIKNSKTNIWDWWVTALILLILSTHLKIFFVYWQIRFGCVVITTWRIVMLMTAVAVKLKETPYRPCQFCYMIKIWKSISTIILTLTCWFIYYNVLQNIHWRIKIRKNWNNVFLLWGDIKKYR